MRLQCEVEVRSRLLPTCGLSGRGRAARALLSLGRPGRGGDPPISPRAGTGETPFSG
uniref:PIF1/LRR1 pleckstrin homology domain-containing protein n=1 Tax=Pelusios castaneus TaxID=367368 RepID=A0A8C8SIZ2_9SAUR